MSRACALLFLLGVTACLPGREGWECELRGATVQTFGSPQTSTSASDCNDGLLCRSASGYSRSGQSTKHVCMAPAATDVSTTYNWMHVILFWACAAILVIAAALVTIKKLRRR